MSIKEKFYANLDLIREEAEQLDEGAMDWIKSKIGLGPKPDIRRMPEKDMDTDVRKGIKDYENDQSEKEMKNAVKTTWMTSSNPTFRTRGRMMDRQEIDSDAKRETVRDKFTDQQNARDIRRNAGPINELRDETKAGYALKAADQITDYMAKNTKYDMSPEGEKKTQGLQKRIRGLQRLDRMEKKKRKIRAIDRFRSKKRK